MLYYQKGKCYFSKSISLPLTFNEGNLAEFSVGGLLLNDIGDKFSQVYYYTTADSKAVLSWDAQPELEAYKCYVDGEHSFKYEPEAAAGWMIWSAFPHKRINSIKLHITIQWF